MQLQAQIACNQAAIGRACHARPVCDCSHTPGLPLLHCRPAAVAQMTGSWLRRRAAGGGQSALTAINGNSY